MNRKTHVSQSLKKSQNTYIQQFSMSSHNHINQDEGSYNHSYYQGGPIQHIQYHEAYNDPNKFYGDKNEQFGEFYDEDIMKQIQMEIYHSNYSTNTNLAQNENYWEEQATEIEQQQPKRNLSLVKKIPQIETKVPNKNNHKNKTNRNPPNTQKTNNNKQHDNQESQQVISVPLESSNIQPSAKLVHKRLNNQPTKKLKSQLPRRDEKFINFSIPIKIIRQNLRIKRVIKCLDSNNIKTRSDARFLVQIQGQNEYQQVSNNQMIHFYKDSLIDYYQGIHFS